MKKIQYNGSSKILNGIVAKVNSIIDKLVVDVKVNGTSVVVVNQEGEREADIDLSLADQNVKQSPTTSSDNSDYRVLLSKSANDTEETDISRKDTNLKYNPSTGNLQTTKLNGNTVPSGSGNDTLAKTSDIPDLSNYVQKSLTVGLIKNDGTIDQTQYATMSDIPDELADLQDDSTHRLVTDTEKSTWNGKAELTDVDKAELNTWNLLRQPYFHGSGTSAGTTRTVNADGSVTFTGTATATYNFNLKRYTQEWKLPQGTYRIKGCPSGGSSTTYYMCVAVYKTSLINLVDDYGDGAIFTLTEESIMQINACVYNGYAIQDSLTFRPYLVSMEKVDWYEQNILGSKNLNSYPYYETSHTEAGITWTDNGDGTVTANNTSTGNSSFICHSRIAGRINPLLLPNGKYILSGCPSGGSDSKYRLVAYVTKNGSASALGTDYGEGVVIEVDGDDNFNEMAYVQIGAYIRGVGFQANNLIFRPMLRLAYIADNTYVPYAKTNRQLTTDKIDWDDYAEYGVKNLIPYPWEHKNGRVNRGITFGCSGEGYVTFNGTASTTQEPFFSYTGTSSTSVANGTYLKISGNKRYRIAIERTDDRLWAIAYVRNLDGTDTSNLNIFVEFEDGSTAIKGSNINTRDSGISHKSLYFIIPNNNEYYIQVDIRCSANTGSYSSSTAKGRVILQPYEISDLSWMPYAKSNYELTTLKAEYKQIATVELTDSASKAYSVGDYMIWRGGFYVVRADIASGGAITLNTNVQATDLGSEVKKSKIWGNENIATIPNSSSSSKVYVTTSSYATEIYVQRMNIKSTTLGINETGYCSVTIPILPSMTNNYFVFMFRGDIDNKLYDGRLLFKKDSNGVYGYVSKVYQDGVLKSANDLEADIVVFEKS